MMFLALVAYTAGALNNSLYAEEFGAANFLNEPGLAVVEALTLQFQPAFMNILPLYIVLLAILPFVLAGFRAWPRLIMFASLALWLAPRSINGSHWRLILGRTECGLSTRLPGRRCSCWGYGLAGGAPRVEFPGSEIVGCSASRRVSRWRDS